MRVRLYTYEHKKLLVMKGSELIEKAKQLIINTFPEYKLEDLDCHGGIETELSKHIGKFTKEQWEVLLSGNASYAFQNGIAHTISWNTDRSIIFKAIEKKFERLSSWTDAETWYTVVQTEYKSPNGLFFRLTERTPYMLSNASRRWEIKLIDENEVTPKLTHTAVILSVDCNGKAYIKNQTTGTLAACEQFVERNMESGTFFKIMERK